MVLTDTAIRDAKPRENKPNKVADSRGLQLLVNPTGSNFGV
jgi:hypothetical protein